MEPCSTRPFLEDIEKKWLSFQLLCAVRDCHTRGVHHGDVKTENVLVTSWNWLYLSDFSSSFKPTFLPEDNPADFSYYFDTSGRRTCYLAPERFLVAGEEPENKGVTWAMDIFSVGCVIAELFIETPIFTLSQLYKYRKGEYDPVAVHLEKIEDREIREMVTHMIQLEPESRYSADEYLNFWRHKVFPEYFYSFLLQYMALITDPSSGRAPINPEGALPSEADDRIDRIYYDFDKISYFLGYEEVKSPQSSQRLGGRFTNRIVPVQLDLPNNRHLASDKLPQADDGTLIFLTLVVSSLRNTARASARVRACDILLAFAERVPDEAKLDRILPYAVTMLSDKSDNVKIAALRTVTQLMELVKVVSPVNAYIFPEYIFPRLQPFILGSSSKPRPLVRATYASCLASLAHSSSRILDIVQALRADGSLPAADPEAEDGIAAEAAYHNLYDVARVDLIDFFEAHTKALLTDSSPLVRRAFLGSVSSLCVFFGSSKSSDVILSHLNTYLNDKDWILKCAFFETVVGVATYIGGTSLEEFILPLMIQALTDPEDFVVEKVLRSFASMANLGLFQRSTTWELLDMASRLSMHPSIWIREAAAHFIASSTKYLDIADKRSIVSRLTSPYMKSAVIEFSEVEILDCLKKPLSRPLFDMAILWATKAEKGLFWKSAAKEGVFTLGSIDTVIAVKSSQKLGAFSSVPRNDEDASWIDRIRNFGMVQEDEAKVIALREYIWRVAMRGQKEKDTGMDTQLLQGVIPLTQLNVTPQTVFFDKQPIVEDQKRSRSTSPSKGNGRRPHTIADALLDASTALEEPTSQDKDSAQAGPVGMAGARSPSRLEVSHYDSQATSLSSSPRTPLDPHNPMKSLAASRADKDASRGRLRADAVQHERMRNETSSTRTASTNGTAERVRPKSSAMDLLNRRETSKASKAYAETSTTSTNAFGRVDAPAQRQLSPAIANGDAKKIQRTVRAGHSYNGSNPNVLNMLDSVFEDQYPIDLIDFGPLVASRAQHTTIRKASGDDEKPWRPEGNAVITFSEHTGPINRILVAPDHAFFLTASDDSTIKVWDTSRLEKNITPRSRNTYHHAPDTKVKALTFVRDTHTFISAATDGSIHAVRVDHKVQNEAARYGKPQLVRQYQLPDAGEYAVWLEHFRADNNSILLIATNYSRIIALNLKSMAILYTLQNPIHHGTPTTFIIDRKHHSWLLVGTTHGILDLWDLRFRIRLRAWGLPGETPIHRLSIHPFKGRGRYVCVAGGTGHPEITVWDIERLQCREVYRACANFTSPPSTALTRPSTKAYEPYDVDAEPSEKMLARFATTSLEPNAVDRGIRALACGVDASEEGSKDMRCAFLITGGADRKVRFWDVTRPDSSMVISGLQVEDKGESGKELPRYEISHPTPSLTLTSEIPPQNPSSANAGGGGGSGGGKNSNAANKGKGKRDSAATGGSKTGEATGGRTSRSTVFSLQQQQLLQSHLDAVTDVAVLESPYGMVVSGDRSGVVYVFQ